MSEQGQWGEMSLLYGVTALGEVYRRRGGSVSFIPQVPL